MTPKPATCLGCNKTIRHSVQNGVPVASCGCHIKGRRPYLETLYDREQARRAEEAK